MNTKIQKNLVKKKEDYYSTPYPLTRALMKSFNEDLGKYNVVEPCAGSGAISRILEESKKFKIIYSYDKNPRDKEVLPIDDFTELENIGQSIGENWKIENDIIITNPPYNQLDRFLEFVKEFKFEKMALLLRYSHSTVQKRTKYFENLSGMVSFNRQLDLSEWVENGEKIYSGGFQYCWFVWGIELVNPLVYYDISPYMVTNKTKSKGQLSIQL